MEKKDDANQPAQQNKPADQKPQQPKPDPKLTMELREIKANDYLPKMG